MTQRDHFIFSISSSSESATKWLLFLVQVIKKYCIRWTRTDCCSIAQGPALQKAELKID